MIHDHAWSEPATPSLEATTRRITIFRVDSRLGVEWNQMPDGSKIVAYAPHHNFE
jgi:hypothetical protein